MDKSEFDRFADEYHALHAQNIAVSGETPDFFAEYKIRDIAAEIERRGLVCESVLDFGAGVGNSIAWVRKHLPAAQLTCIDVSQRSLDVAKQRFGERERFIHFDGDVLPFDAPSFDLAYAMCVFHHIPHEEHVRLLGEIRRVLRPGGLLVIFEHNPFNPLTVKAVNTCEFDVNARLIPAAKMRRASRAAGFDQIDVRYRIFFPHALKALRPMERYLSAMPLGAQYSLYAVRT
jgi:SAM-dependent methyltransferase